MADHKVSDQDLDTLNQLINAAGVTTSAINTAQSEVEKNATPSPVTNEARDLILWHNNAGVTQNQQQDKIQQAMQKWHDAVKTGKPVDATVPPSPPTPKPPTGGTEPQPEPPAGVQQFPSSDPRNTENLKHGQMAQGVTYVWSGEGKKNISFAIGSGGYPCFGSLDENDMGAGYAGGTPHTQTPDGAWQYFMRYDADPGRVQDARVTIM